MQGWEKYCLLLLQQLKVPKAGRAGMWWYPAQTYGCVCEWRTLCLRVQPPSWLCPQGLSVVEQEKLDNLMLELDGTENKCKQGLAGEG